MRGGPQAHGLRLGFEARILHHGKTSAKRAAHAAGTLLDDVSQFMAQELLALR